MPVTNPQITFTISFYSMHTQRPSEAFYGPLKTYSNWSIRFCLSWSDNLLT